MITDIFICCTLIRVFLLAFWAVIGKVFSVPVSFRIFNLVLLLWHMGHIIHSLFILNAPIPANHLQLYHMRINFACVHQFSGVPCSATEPSESTTHFIRAAYGTHTVGDNKSTVLSFISLDKAACINVSIFYIKACRCFVK